MRINIEVKDDLLKEVMEMSHAKTTDEAIEHALREYLRILSLQDLKNLRGKINWDGDLDEMRSH